MSSESNKNKFQVRDPIGSCTWTDGITCVVRMLHVRETRAYILQNVLIKACWCIRYTGFNYYTCHL